MSATGIPDMKSHMPGTHSAQAFSGSVASANPRPHDTGFDEPLSSERNTTVPHPDAVKNPHEDMTGVVAGSQKKRNVRIPHRHKKDGNHSGSSSESFNVENDDLQVYEHPENQELQDGGKKGKAKHIMKKLACQE